MDCSRERQRLKRQMNCAGVRLDRLAGAFGHDPLIVERRQLERVDLTERGLVPARLDPNSEPEQVEQRRHLIGGGLDQIDETRLALGERARARQRLRKAVDGRERRPQVVTGERDEAGEPVVCHLDRRCAPQPAQPAEAAFGARP